uniref:KASH domain containing 5 n=1 Tax=Canis lupus dingo TaxID=286419 RepID=A0A8C0LHB6_CANLU
MDVPEGQAGGPAAKMYLWDQLEEGSLGTLLSLEEQILNSMFEACDTQRTGIVAVTHVLAYLEAVTGRGPQDTRLRTLACNLDPNGEGPQATVDLDTFLAVMRDWIAACQLDGASSPHCSHPLPRLGRWRVVACDQPFPDLRPATADLLSSLEDLELSNRRLAGENAKLQRSVETAEEGATRLGEEITALQQQHLVAEMETLQEENGKLLAERDGVKRRSEELATEKEALKVPPLPGGHFISFRGFGLLQRTHHAEGLAKTLEEYRTTTQELRLEISHLEEKLSQTQEGPDELSEGAQVRRVGWTRLLPPSLGVEIEAIQQKQEVAAAALSSPLCGVWQWEEVAIEMDEEAEFPSKAPTGAQVSMGRAQRPLESRIPSLSPLSLQESLPIPLGDPHPGDIPGSPPESPAEPELQQALVPVVKELFSLGASGLIHRCGGKKRLRG